MVDLIPMNWDEVIQLLLIRILHQHQTNEHGMSSSYIDVPSHNYLAKYSTVSSSKPLLSNHSYNDYDHTQ